MVVTAPAAERPPAKPTGASVSENSDSPSPKLGRLRWGWDRRRDMRVMNAHGMCASVRELACGPRRV
ncbi:hypothetical protein GCM10010211_77420 [Streptomyces albospinus]|uniref:Transposase n=1 Tax=Streptomyces albospinus TaxID=285515 RepID=A0ABQ2VPM9_9ACTN|nr:hypothetical protein GCM10010211_77420 [Streptomyces albospinus]